MILNKLIINNLLIKIFIHLLANMFSLIFIGIRLEREFGFGEFCKLLQAFRQLHISNVYLESEYHIDTHLFYKAN